MGLRGRGRVRLGGGDTRLSRERVCWRRRRRRGVGLWVGVVRAFAAALVVSQTLHLLAELVALRLECPPQLLQPLDFALKCFEFLVPYSFLLTQKTMMLP